MTEIKLVIFDCDGVLLDSEIVAAAAELEVYSNYGIEMDVLEFAGRFAGLDSQGVKSRIEQELGRELPEKVIEDTRAKVNEKVANEAKIIKDADTVLDLLDQARCICSNSPKIRLEKSLSRVGLYDKFRPYVFSAQETDPPVFKPKPDIFIKAMEEFGYQPNETVIVEDSIHGVEGGVSAGARVIGFTGASHTWHGHAQQLQDAGAETVINRMAALPGMIEAFTEWSGF